MDANALAAAAKQQQEASQKAEPRQHALQNPRIQKLIKGEAEAPNEYAKFIVEQVRDILAKGETLGAQLEKARTFIKEGEREALQLAGAAEQYLIDLGKWDHQLESQSVGEEVPKNGATKPTEGEANA